MTTKIKKLHIQGVRFENSSAEYSKFVANGVLDYVAEMGDVRVKGVAGCWIAHAKALEAIKYREGCSLVLEDDFVFKRGFFANLAKIIEAVDFEFDLILIDPMGSGPYEKDRILDHIYDTDNVCHPHYHGTHCVLVKNSSIDKVIGEIYSSPIRDIDGFYLCNENLNVYVAYTGKATTVYFNSNVDGIESNIKLFWLGFLRWFRYRYL